MDSTPGRKKIVSHPYSTPYNRAWNNPQQQQQQELQSDSSCRCPMAIKTNPLRMKMPLGKRRPWLPTMDWKESKASKSRGRSGSKRKRNSKEDKNGGVFDSVVGYANEFVSRLLSCWIPRKSQRRPRNWSRKWKPHSGNTWRCRLYVCMVTGDDLSRMGDEFLKVKHALIHS